MAFALIEHFPGMKLRCGVDTTTGDAKPSFAVTGEIGPDATAGGVTGGFEFVHVETESEFEKSINASASISYGTSLLGKSLGASAKSSFKDRCKFSNSATFCVIRFTLDNPFETFLETPKLVDEAAELLRLNKMERFRERFGNRFVSGRFTGAEFFACVRIEASSTEKQREIRAEIEANFGAFNSSGSGSNVQSMLSSEDSINILTLQTGGLIEPVFTLEEVMDRARVVAQQAQNGLGFPTGVTVEDYGELNLPNDDVSFVQHQHARETLNKLARDYRALQLLQNEIEFVLRNPGFFKNPRIGRLNQDLTKIVEMLNRIVDAADTCVRDVSQCELVPVTIPNIDFPQRKSESPSDPGRGIGGPGGLTIGGASPPPDPTERLSALMINREAIALAAMRNRT